MKQGLLLFDKVMGVGGDFKCENLEVVKLSLFCVGC